MAPDRGLRSRPSARTQALVGLVILTSVAVGATTSAWLVPPYLLAMGWLLHAPDASQDRSRAETRESASPNPPRREPPPDTDPPSTVSPEIPTPEPATPKPKRRRPRNVAKAEPPPPAVRVEATWVQVVPGKFVRVERPVTESEAQPQTDTPEVAVGSDFSDLGDPSDAGPAAAPDRVASDPISEPTPSPIDAPEAMEQRESSEDSTSGPASSLKEGGLADAEDEASRHREWLDVVLGSEGDDSEASDRDRPIDDLATPATSVASHDRAPRRTSHAPANWFRIRRDPRPISRRGTGRVGPRPRVSLGRG